MRKPVAMLLALAAHGLAAAPGRADERITFGTDWRAEAEYGGYYQALASGIYRRHGLDVTIRQGGASVNQTQLLLAGRLDISIVSNSFVPLNFVQEGIPFRAVAAMFQKDPSVLIAHPGQGNDSFAALRGKPIMISADTRVGWWNYLRSKFGYSDAQIRPYTFNLQPFLADQRAIQQGFLGSEPYSIRQAAGFDPVVLLVADAGFTGYAQLFAVSDRLIETRPEVVQRFIDASAEGWAAYLGGDPGPGDARIKADNPEMTDALLGYGRGALQQHGIVLSGDAAAQGIGAMTEARWAGFFASVAGQGLYRPDLDWHRAFTLRFVGRPAAGKP